MYKGLSLAKNCLRPESAPLTHSLVTAQVSVNSMQEHSNAILFQIEVLGRKIEETALAMYFIKVTRRPSFA